MRGPNRSTWCQIRAEDTSRLHSIAIKLQGQRLTNPEGLTDRQELLWDQIIGELEWRSARVRRPYTRCLCELCFFDPFELEHQEDDEL
jgi:hypothetical protein